MRFLLLSVMLCFDSEIVEKQKGSSLLFDGSEVDVRWNKDEKIVKHF